MRWVLILWVCAVCGVAMAQTAAEQTDSDQPASASESDVTDATVAGETPDPLAEPASPPEEEESEPGAIADAVEENVPPQPPEEGDLSELEFEPGEEISEDYPVPLPSDI